MRTPPLALLCLVAPCLVSGAEQGKLSDEPAAADEKPAPAPPPRPEVRNLQIRGRTRGDSYLFKVSLIPGVPDPGRVVAVRLEMFELPVVPDPIHGEQIPVKDAQIRAEVTDADGAGYTLTYSVHPLADAGSYGFHVTPARQDTFRVVLKAEYQGRKAEGAFRLGAGIWPLPASEDEDRSEEGGESGGGGRLPAMPGGGVKVPAMPGGGPAAAGAGPAVRQGSPLAQVMERLGEGWVELQVLLHGGRTPDLGRVKALAEPLRQTALAGAGLRAPEADFDRLLAETAEALGQLGSVKDPLAAFQRIGAHQCNQCHFVYRWRVLGSLAEFPGGLP
jgi:hypothetical protein